MNREEAIRAMLDGKKVSFEDGNYCYYDCTRSNPFRYVGSDGHDEGLAGAWCATEWQIYEEPKPKKRYMTREEVLGFVCNTPGIVVRHYNSIWHPVQHWSYERMSDKYEYAYIDEKGSIGEPHKFMIEETS